MKKLFETTFLVVLLVPLLSSEAACQISTESATFDAQAWLVEVREALDAYDSEDNSEIKQLANQLDDAVDWRRACDTYREEDGAQVYDPLPLEHEHWARGHLEVEHIVDNTHLVAVTCHFGAYQGSYALVHIVGDEVHIVRAPDLSSGSQPTEYDTAIFSTPRYDGIADGRFQTLGVSRGLGDCGTFVSYYLVEPDWAAIEEVRHQECEYSGEPVIDPLDWPVVYTSK
ncbi:MAG: hypothetical protein R3284_04410 [Rubricoccaceae bacterium]|nr:hypothetical protein [Rubricoccaceae bacterium]